MSYIYIHAIYSTLRLKLTPCCILTVVQRPEFRGDRVPVLVFTDTFSVPFTLRFHSFKKERGLATSLNNQIRAQELCERQGGRRGPRDVPNSPCGLCGRTATFNEEEVPTSRAQELSERRSGLLGLPPHIIIRGRITTVSVDA